MDLAKSVKLALLSLTVCTLAGCTTFSGPVAVAPALPDIPAKTAAECRDPGVPPVGSVKDAVTVIGGNRLYAACYKRQFRNMKAFYRTVQKGYSAPK